MKIKLGVIFGGESVEHEVSIISALQAIEHLDKDKYEIMPIYITKNKEWFYGPYLTNLEIYKDIDLVKRYAKRVILTKKDNRFILQATGLFKKEVAEIDLMFPIVHGTHVEDGTLQGYLETVGVPYVGSSVYASAVGQDKVFMKQILEAEKIPLPAYRWCFDVDYDNNHDDMIAKFKELKLPLFVKPSKLGSSVGITKVNDYKDLDEALREAFQYDNKVVVEEGVSNLKEANISVLGNHEYQELSEIEEVISSNDFLTYSDKYLQGGKKGKMVSNKGMASSLRNIPADLDRDIKEEIRRQAKLIFRALNTEGVCRIDFLVDDKNKKVYTNEINTIPGSLSFYLWEPAHKKYSDLLDELINMAIKSYKKNQKLVFSFDSNILQNFDGTKGIKGLKK